MEMKEFYIAPEVEIICFRPVETLADDSFWNLYGRSGGTGETGNEGVVESYEPGGGGEEDPGNGEP